MFGAFKPSLPLSGGLLWKIPWRLSAPRKLRHRRRLRRVDNVVAVLDNALKRRAASLSQQISPSAQSRAAATIQNQANTSTNTSPSDPPTTAEGQNPSLNASQESRRHGKGPKQGDMVPEFTPQGVEVPSQQLLGSAAQLQGTIKLIERWKAEMPTEQEMLPKDKYTMFDRKAKGYRKGVHKLPKWTRVSQRLNPPGF